jgi:hypothetical protein
MPFNEKLYNIGDTVKAQLPSTCQCNLFLENTHLSDMTNQLGAEETYYVVHQCNFPQFTGEWVSAGGKIMSDDTVPP